MVRVSLLDTLAQGYHSPHRFGRSGNSSSPSGKFLRVAFLWLLTFAVLGLRYRLRAYRFGGRGRSLRALWRSALKLRFVISARLTSPQCFVLYPTARLNLSLYSKPCLPLHRTGSVRQRAFRERVCPQTECSCFQAARSMWPTRTASGAGA